MELETGKWYVRVETGTYLKYKDNKSRTVHASEYIQKINDKYCFFGNEGLFGNKDSSIFKEIIIEEIRQYLPHDHPDLKSSVNPLQDDNMNLLKLLQLHEIK